MMMLRATFFFITAAMIAGCDGESSGGSQTEELDTVEITSVTPNVVTEGVSTTFTVEVKYDLASSADADLMIGFNHHDDPLASVIVNSVEIAKGTGSVELSATVTPVKWDEATPFSAYANLSPIDRGSSWSPLVSTKFPLTVEAANTTSYVHAMQIEQPEEKVSCFAYVEAEIACVQF